MREMNLQRRLVDRGAAAVEFALVLPVLLALTLGTVAFGHAFHVQTVLDNAARDAVRIFALQNSGDPAANARAQAIASSQPAVTLTADQVAVTPAGCPAGQNARVTITVANFELLGGIGRITLEGSGSMRCNG